MEMKRRLHAQRKKLILLGMIPVLLCFLVLSGGLPADAEEQPVQTVRAGYFKLSGYHMMDDEGIRSGYGYEFLTKVAQYSNLDFSYIGYNQSYTEQVEMLENGELDILTFVRKTEEMEEKFLFSEYIGIDYSILTAKEGNTQIESGNYATYEGIKVGMLREGARKTDFDEFAQEQNFSYEAVYYDTSDQLTTALQEGEVDAVISSSFRVYSNEQQLDVFKQEEFYAVVRKGDEELLAQINAAIEKMTIYDTNWRIDLNDKYSIYSGAIFRRFTDEEQELIKEYQEEGRVFRVICNPDRYPYSYFEDGEAKGIVPDIFAQIMELAGLEYEVIETVSREEYHEVINSGDVDIVMDQQIDAGKAEKLGYIQTIPYFTTSLCRLRNKKFSGKVETAAVIEVSAYQVEAALADNENCELKYYDYYQECFEAVKNGEADATYLLIYIAEACIAEDDGDNFTYSILAGREYETGIGVRRELDRRLLSVLNKSVYEVKQMDVQPIVDSYLTSIKPSMTWKRFVGEYPWVLPLAVVILLLIAAFSVRYVVKDRSEKALKQNNLEMKRQNELLEEQRRVIDGLAHEYIALFLLNMNAETIREYLRLKNIHISVEKAADYETTMYEYIDRYVKEENREELKRQISLEHLREVIPRHGIYFVNYERILDGRTDHCQINYANVATEQEEQIVVIGFRYVNDIVEKELEQKHLLEDALARAEQANRAKTTFLSNMSHDIRTPMNAIIGFTALATTHIKDEEQVRNYLGKIMTSGNHLLSLINDLLDMSRIESGRMTLNETECNLAEMMHDLKDIIQTDIHSKQLELLIDTVDVLDEDVFCDKLRLNQIFLNLLGNAMKFTRPGGTVSVRIIEKKDAPAGYGSYEFRVKDTGIGMSPAFLKNIFEPFERERNTTVSKIPGTGLGMAITKSIVDMMNGTITVTSEPDKGTEFVVNLQFRLQSSPKKAEKIPKLEGVRALVVDDDFNTCDSVTNMLIQIGMRAEWTMSGKEAVLRTRQAVERNDTYYVYILDWLMPDMNGIEVARRVRQEVGQDIPIIILTAYDWSEIEEEAKAAGVTGFVSKPLFMSELQKCLLRLCYPERTAEEETEKKKQIDFGGRRILLVEDNELNLEIATEILKEAGFVVEEAQNGQIAVDMVKAAAHGYYDLVLMDVQMPVMNGYEASQAIRNLEDPELANIPIIAMTANAFEEDRKLALEHGMNEHMTKPIDVARLIELLQKYIG